MGTLANKKIVLVGGAGFIGHNLALELVRLGAKVEVVDSLQVNNLLSLTTEMATCCEACYTDGPS